MALETNTGRNDRIGGGNTQGRGGDRAKYRKVGMGCMSEKTGFELLFSSEEREEREETAEEKEQRRRERDEKRDRETGERWRREQRRAEKWRKSEQEKAERTAERYIGGEVGVERWLISHL